MLSVVYSKSALKSLRKIQRAQEKRIRDAIDALATDPRDPSLDIKPLTGQPYFRLRVGGYRVIFDQDGKILSVKKIAPRGSAYSD